MYVDAVSTIIGSTQNASQTTNAVANDVNLAVNEQRVAAKIVVSVYYGNPASGASVAGQRTETIILRIVPTPPYATIVGVYDAAARGGSIQTVGDVAGCTSNCATPSPQDGRVKAQLQCYDGTADGSGACTTDPMSTPLPGTAATPQPTTYSVDNYGNKTWNTGGNTTGWSP